MALHKRFYLISGPLRAPRWLYSVADDFFTRQLPHNVTWGLTVLYALDASENLADVALQARAHAQPPA